jgi:hypothetical protein
MEYNYNDNDISPSNNLEYYDNTLEHHNEDYDTGINDMFLSNLNPTFYTMQMQNPDVLTHAQMKQQVGAEKALKRKDQKLKDYQKWELLNTYQKETYHQKLDT